MFIIYQTERPKSFLEQPIPLLPAVFIIVLVGLGFNVWIRSEIIRKQAIAMYEAQALSASLLQTVPASLNLASSTSMMQNDRQLPE